jgi:uncharacterized membrane protein YdjX (TVP38/TMEM64 family)
LSFETFVHYQVQLREMVAEHRLAMLGLYILVYVVAVSLSLPVSAFLTAIGGYLFGWFIGGAMASLSATLGATSLFLIARTSLGGPLLKRAGRRMQQLAEGFRRQAFSYLLSLRLMPVIPFWLTNLAAAFFGMRLKSYILATWLGMLPVCFAFAVAGPRQSRKGPPAMLGRWKKGLFRRFFCRKPVDARAADCLFDVRGFGLGACCCQILAHKAAMTKG